MARAAPLAPARHGEVFGRGVGGAAAQCERALVEQLRDALLHAVRGRTDGGLLLGGQRAEAAQDGREASVLSPEQRHACGFERALVGGGRDQRARLVVETLEL